MKQPFAVTRLTAHFTCALMSDLVIRYSFIFTLRPDAIKQHKLKRSADEYRFESHQPLLSFTRVLQAHMFDTCPKGFMRMLCMCIKPKLFLPNQIIVTRGDVSHEMYYIHNGEVDVLSEHDNETPIATLKKGKMFGEVIILYSF